MNQLDRDSNLAQPPGGYGPPPGGGPPGGWGPPPGGAPPGGWGPPGGGPPPGGALLVAGVPPAVARPVGLQAALLQAVGDLQAVRPLGAAGDLQAALHQALPREATALLRAAMAHRQALLGTRPDRPALPPVAAAFREHPRPAFPAPGGAKPAFSPGDAITFAWERIKADPGTILATIIVGLIIVGVVSATINFAAQLIVGLTAAATSVAVGAGSHRHAPQAIDFMAAPLALALMGVGQLVSLIVSTFFTAGIMNFSLKVARGAPYAFGDIFGGAPFFLSLLAANFIMALGIIAGSICLIVPGVILALGLSMSMPLIVDRGLGPIEALKTSWQLTDGNKGNIFIFWLIGFGLSIAGVCACCVAASCW